MFVRTFSYILIIRRKYDFHTFYESYLFANTCLFIRFLFKFEVNILIHLKIFNTLHLFYFFFDLS